MKSLIQAMFLMSVTLLAVLGYFLFRDWVLVSASESKECVPYDLRAESSSSNSVVVSFRSNGECKGAVGYSVDPVEGGEIVGFEQPRYEHRFEINDLKPGQQYYIVVYSDEVAYGLGGLPILVSTKSL